MAQKQKKLRLDEILLKEGLITESEIREALLRQKVHGGKFGTQLLYYHYIDEIGLVKALSIQFNCDGVVLSDFDIPQDVIELVPAKHAVIRRIIPFDFDKKSNTIKIACENPEDSELKKDIEFIANGKYVQLYVTSQLGIETAIDKFYLGQDTKLEDKQSLVLPDLSLSGYHPEKSEKQDESETRASFSKSVLIITDEEYSGSLYQTVLERDNYQVVICDSIEKASILTDDMVFNTVLIKNGVDGDHTVFMDKLRRNSPQTNIKIFASSSALILNEESLFDAEETLISNLNLFTSMLSSKANMPDNHSGEVGGYVHKLCIMLELPVQARMVITNAAYLHDLAKYYYPDEELREHLEINQLTIKLLESLGYSEAVINILNSVYEDLQSDYTKHLPLDVLGGNIIRIVDHFWRNIEKEKMLTIDKLEELKKELRELAGKLFLDEVVEAFIGMMQEDLLNSKSNIKSGQVILFSTNQDTSYSLELRLKNERFRVVSEFSSKTLLELYRRSTPDILILALKGRSEEIITTVDDFARKGIDYKKTPTFLLVESPSTSKLVPLFDMGIEDVIPIGSNYDLLVVKLNKIASHLIERSQLIHGNDESSTGTKGRLTDLNLIDLMQAMAPGRKTVKITVTPKNSEEDKLLIYLNKGAVIFAQFKDKTGPEAIYEGITWDAGSWVTEAIDEKELPQPNNTLPNDAILLEGVCRLDEKSKAGSA
ncbi:MAG: DUF4388 domain-containing protein [candidate division Zixibacteria bacterium]|nr:DUF4388 domain-containing protein [candidate division Zixibacteria bacterium]